MGNIEQLKKEVDEIKSSLNALKNNVSLSDSEKKNKIESIKSQAETVKDKIQKEISSLESKTDDASKKKKEQAETLLNSLNEITTLYTSITNTSKSTLSIQSKQPETKSENKNIFAKAKDWIKEQWNETTRDNLKKKPWATLLRGVWFAATWVWALALAYKWLKSLWNSTFWKKKKKSKDTDNESRTDNESDTDNNGKTPEKKSFWNTKLWKALTWLWIWSAAWGGFYFLGKKFNRWGNTNKPTSTDNNEPTTADSTWSTASWVSSSSSERSDKQNENVPKWWNKVSEDMFQQLLQMEGANGFVAQIQSKDFWEKFPTWPYGQVYKYIDKNWNPLGKAVPFKNWERVTKEWALKNARTRYDTCAKEWKEALDKRHLDYNQNELDSLVSASWGTIASRRRLESYVFSNWSNKDSVSKFMSTFATTAAWNGKVMPGLVSRRKFESNRFKWIKRPYSYYQKHRT